MQSNRKAVVAHLGARDHYELAKALHETNQLERLVTDFMLPTPFSYALPITRSSTSLPLDRVMLPLTSLYMFGQRILDKKNTQHLVENIGTDLGLNSLAIARKKKADLFLYSYDAYDAFKKGKDEGYEGKRILFQVHPHPTSVRELLGTEIERIPYSKQSILDEMEFKLEAYCEKLARAPALAQHILTASSFTKQTLVENGIDPAIISVVPYGVNFEHFEYKPRTYQPNNQILKVLFVGSMVQRKGIADLLIAIQSLHSHNIQLTICGRGGFDDNILSLFKDINLTVKRNLTRAELRHEMQTADVFALPSIVEGFALVILEAMSCGLPVITTPNTCAPDVIQENENGFIVPIKSAPALATKIQWCLENKQKLPEMSANAAKRAREFSWERFRRGVTDFYNHI